MIVVVAAEPGAWLAPAVTALSAIDRVELWAPWAMGPRWATLPGPAGRFARRRTLEGAASVPGWAIVQAAARAWAGEQVDRRYRLSFAERAAVDVWAARRLAALRRRPRAVVACSGAAQRTFAAAQARGVATVLVADLPWLRRLHDDLDRAAEVLPERGFLRRFRAGRAAIVRQEMERTLATAIAVRGHHAADVCVAAGVARERLVALPAAARAAARGDGDAGTAASGEAREAASGEAREAASGEAREAVGGDVVVLAGLAAARGGVDVALAARERLPGLRLRVRTGEGTEPADLLARAGVEAMRGDPLRGALAVLAPAWCESYPAEVAAGAARGVPVIASAAAAGFDPAVLVPPGDADALAGAIAGVRAGTLRPAARPPLPPLAAALGR